MVAGCNFGRIVVDTGHRNVRRARVFATGAWAVSLDAELLRKSFELIVDRDPAVTHRFYQHLFADFPQAKPLFRATRIEDQEKMLGEAIAAVLDHLEDAPWLTSHLGALGARHVDYGVTDEMYGWVGASLLKTFAQVSGKDWSPNVEAAWGAAYGAIVQLMQAGAKQLEPA
jgi:hemoglobin-like flavoprotein